MEHILDLQTPARRAFCRAVQPEFANTEPKPVSTSLAVAKQAEASEGPERTGHKPLMRNPSADVRPSQEAHTASDTLSGGVESRHAVEGCSETPEKTERCAGPQTLPRKGLEIAGQTRSHHVPDEDRSAGSVEDSGSSVPPAQNSTIDLATYIQEQAELNRSRHSIAFSLAKHLKACATVEEGLKIVDRHCPWL